MVQRSPLKSEQVSRSAPRRSSTSSSRRTSTSSARCRSIPPRRRSSSPRRLRPCSRACATSYQSAVNVAEAIMTGAIDTGVAGGADSASNVPITVSKRLAEAGSPRQSVEWWIDEIFSFVRQAKRAEGVAVLSSISIAPAGGPGGQSAAGPVQITEGFGCAPGGSGAEAPSPAEVVLPREGPWGGDRGGEVRHGRARQEARRRLLNWRGLRPLLSYEGLT